MQTKNQNSERGQAIVLIVLAMIVLLGFTALAVDGSMVFSDRRMLQNAADASSLAGGATAIQQIENMGITQSSGWTASPPTCLGNVATAANTGRAAAIARGADNDFNLPDGITEQFGGVKSECREDGDDASVVGGGTVEIFPERFMEITTVLKHKTETAFAHFVFDGALENTVSATTRVKPRQSLAYGYAIVALNPNQCQGNQNGVQFFGLGGWHPKNAAQGSLDVQGGGVWSNGCMEVDGNVDVTVHNAGATYFFTANNYDLDDIVFDPSGSPTQLVNNSSYRIPETAYQLPVEPDCTGHDVTADFIADYWDENNAPLPAGLYCVTGDLRLNNANEHVEGYGVTLLLKDGLMSVNGGANVKLEAPTTTLNGGVPGLLIYAPANNPNIIILNGGAETLYTGTILAPTSAVEYNGNENSILRGQIIAYNVGVGGASGTGVVYNDSNPVYRPALLNLEK
jgi:hypothetical protein